MSTQYPLILVDASGYLFRAYHAMPKLTNAHGEPTGAVVGVLIMLQNLIDEYQPDYLGVVFDAGGRNFRHELFPAYKAQRPPLPDDLRPQFAPLQAAIQALGWPLLIVPDVEADDVIGTLATQAAAAGIATLIATSDKDLAQLVCERIHLLDTMKNRLLDPAGVVTTFGVPPERIADYLALKGDSSDNIPGVPGCGDKTAIQWLTQFGDLDGIIAHAHAIPRKVGDNLRAALPQLPLLRQLTTIKCDVPLALHPTDLRPTAADNVALRELYLRLESQRLLKTIGAMNLDLLAPASTAPTAPPQLRATYDLILTPEQLEPWLARLAAAELFAFDTETTGLDVMTAELVGVSFAVAPEQAAYIPLAHRYFDVPAQLERATVLAQLRPLLEDASRAKVGQNLKFDLNILTRYGITLRGIAHDTMLASYVLDSTAASHGMDALAQKHLDYTTIHFEDVAGKGRKQITFDQVTVETAAQYAAEDADITLRLQQKLWPQVLANPKLTQLYQELELPLIPVLARMERTGVKIDSNLLAQQSVELAQRLAALELNAYETAGRRFNLNSPKQIGAILFTELELPVVRKTPKGEPSTSEDVLEQLAEQHALPRLILDHRSLAKLKSTYTDALPKLVNSTTGRLHTSYHQAITATGRLSSSDPNLQNIPIRTEDGRRIRQAFIATSGYQIVSADYSQIELRIMAHLSGDERLLAAFMNGLDVHRATAAEILQLPLDEITTEQRRAAKAVNFGLMYGMSAFGLAQQIGCGKREAASYMERYFERYVGVKEFMERIRQQARANGYVETLFGRRLHLIEINHSNQARRAAAERTAINAPMQGTAADIIKRAMLAVDHWIETEQPPVKLLLQVHDELVFEIATDAVAMASERIRVAMEAAAELAVPLIVDIGHGDNWDAAH
ncbi:DNA polymerase I [Chromatium okenii]|uniref:DNA polymerase I n=1 Tax=Chromatium okenii TaxID=61644 RepID=UPI0026EBD638|nr:DNA polymerase I [Chromatium okenii]MBV5310438.1 DNA polymerase I [Chromatium okenii]